MSTKCLVLLSFLAFSITAIALPDGRFSAVDLNPSLLDVKTTEGSTTVCVSRGSLDDIQNVPAKRSQQFAQESVNQSENEVPFPVEDNWVEQNGVEYQLSTSSPEIFTTAKSLVYYVWIRNSSNESKSVRVVSHPSFLTHFDLQVTSEGGESLAVGQCLKKHDYRTIVFSPGQMRGFRMDAFEGWCRRLESLPEVPTSITLAYRGARLRVQTRL